MHSASGILADGSGNWAGEKQERWWKNGLEIHAAIEQITVVLFWTSEAKTISNPMSTQLSEAQIKEIKSRITSQLDQTESEILAKLQTVRKSLEEVIESPPVRESEEVSSHTGITKLIRQCLNLVNWLSYSRGFEWFIILNLCISLLVLRLAPWYTGMLAGQGFSSHPFLYLLGYLILVYGASGVCRNRIILRSRAFIW